MVLECLETSRSSRCNLVFRLVAAFRGKQLRMDANWMSTGASRRQDATPQEGVTPPDPLEAARVAMRLWPSWVDDAAEEREIDEVAPGLEDLGLFA
jgi:hypothetical protein